MNAGGEVIAILREHETVLESALSTHRTKERQAEVSTVLDLLARESAAVGVPKTDTQMMNSGPVEQGQAQPDSQADIQKGEDARRASGKPTK